METHFIFLTLIGFVATFIGTLGGGGGLINLPAMLLLGVPIHTAIAANKFSNTFSSFSSFYTVWKRGEIDIKTGLKIIPFTMLGGVLGAFLASTLDEPLLLKIALILLIFATLLNILKSKMINKAPKDQQTKLFYPTYIGIGSYDGLFGPGQATLLMHSFMNAGYSYINSIGLTRLQTFSSCFVSFLVYFSMGHFDWRVGVALGIGSVIGAQSAVRLADHLHGLPWKNILTGFSIYLIIYLSYKIFW
ncbi:sulfite exporter TauE/SafE family protein [Sutcliffiella rhizosphaerae]|uniref:Probable membrane transporter protein n=1 Tax=Sutcliffiella rhizosphaerae TaxID=2880967 RepID=A0ABM8YJ67_9BACI|nr:sulfite exporter TauE/SafE family protein [Sutcliffiella rhizosphaerae]CAG9619900.1 putative membrane transporter protein YfcA [Sutcliffiella rhizosphaerae]